VGSGQWAVAAPVTGPPQAAAGSTLATVTQATKREPTRRGEGRSAGAEAVDCFV